MKNLMTSKKGQANPISGLVGVVVGIVALGMIAMFGVIFLVQTAAQFPTNGNVTVIKDTVVNGIVTGASLFGVLLLAGVIGFAIAFFLGVFNRR